MSEEKHVCDLCGLPVLISGFALRTKNGPKYFCCEGCQGIYQMLHKDEQLQETPDTAR